MREVQIGNTEFEAFSGYPLEFAELMALDTKSLRVAIDKGTFTPPAKFEVDGRIDGEIEDQTSFTAGDFNVDLSSGEFRWPGGPRIGVEAPSHLEVRDLRVRSDGSYSGIVEAALFGKVGAIDRSGTSLAASDVQFHTHGARIVDGNATGDVRLDFQYRLNHTLVVHYPVEELRDRLGNRRLRRMRFKIPEAVLARLRSVQQKRGYSDKVTTAELRFS